MKFNVGYQNNPKLKQSILEKINFIDEIFFPWESFATGRSENISRKEMNILEEDLQIFSKNKLKLDLLLNGNCFGRHALSRNFYQKIGDTVDYLIEEYNLTCVTTTSCIIASFLKKNFFNLEVRASVNMEISTIEGMDYLLDVFDSFYLKRELNYNFAIIQKLYDFCHQNGKKLYLLANSGCLNYCSARTFHDNLVAHQDEISQMDNAFNFEGVCHKYLSDKEKRTKFLSISNFIRPEDIYLYENLCDGIKLATRTNINPSGIVEAYCSKTYRGNLLNLTEPDHSKNFLPEIIDNGKIPSNYASTRLTCSKNCQSCQFCYKVLEESKVNLDSMYKI